MHKFVGLQYILLEKTYNSNRSVSYFFLFTSCYAKQYFFFQFFIEIALVVEIQFNSVGNQRDIFLGQFYIFITTDDFLSEK